MIVVSILILVVGILTGVVLNLVFFWDRPVSPPATPKTDGVAVLIAARNEERNIENCISSLLNQNSHSPDFQILIGDDESTDQTLAISNELADKHPELEVYAIRETIGNARGKGNIVAQLIQRTKAGIYCITDADMTLSRGWVAAMLAGLTSNNGICIGVTAVAGKSVAARFQNLDWLLAQGMIKVATKVNFPVTSLGNNMAVSREAYQSIGGLESLPKTITEDFQMFRYIRRQGYKLGINMTPEALCFTKPAIGFEEWLNQRKRWAFGAIRIHWFPLVLLVANLLIFPAAIILAPSMPVLAGSFVVTHYLVQGLFLEQIISRIEMKINWFDYLAFQTITLLIGWLLAVYCLWPGRIVWKDRAYSFWKL